VSVLLGNGDGTFQSATAFDSGSIDTLGVAIADVNADGKPDVVVASEETDVTTQNGAVGVLLGNGDGTLQQAVVYSSGASGSTSIAAADVNGDGKIDLVVANQCSSTGQCYTGYVSVFLGNGDGTFQQPVLYYSGAYLTSSVAVTDVNGDARPDIIVSNYCVIIACPGSSSGSVGVLLGNGDGTFQPAVTYSSGDYGAASVTVGDVNGDALPDLLVVNFGSSPNYTGLVGVLLGNGDGTFQSVVTYSSGADEGFSIALGDLNADGKPDVVVADEYTTAGVNPIGEAGVLINTSLAATKTVLNSSLNPSSFGQTVTFTATVTAYLGGTPTGTVTFLDGTTSLGSSTLNSSGVANFPINTLAVGTHSITASYSGDPTFGPSTSSVLNQLVQGSIVVLSPSSLNFGNQTVGLTSVAQGVTLTNTGNITLTISSIGVTGTNSADFGETNNCPGSLAPSVSCTISVTFTPTTTGTRTAAVAITDNAPGSPQLISLTGVGVLPAVTFSPGHLTFPTQIVFTSSKAQVVTLTNTGLGLLTIASITANGPFSETNTCGSSINPGASCTISVIFMPTTSGVITGSVSITDNAPGSPQLMTLKGTGTYIQLAPISVNFGNQPVGTTSLAKKITLTNKGSVAVNISSIAITGLNAGDFAETNTCGRSIAAGGSCFIKVTFTPTTTGLRTASVSISDNGGGSPQKVSLSGTGT
jgi:hypothetical protein